MKRTTLRIAFVFVLTFISFVQYGCCYKLRNCSFVTVNDVGGNLTTKYSYNPAIVKDETELPTVIGNKAVFKSRFVEGAMRSYPRVFSPSGIRIAIRINVDPDDSGCKYAWTQLLCAFSLFIFPACEKYYRSFSVELEMVDDETTNENFQLKRTREFSEGLFPFAFIPFSGTKNVGTYHIEQTEKKGLGDTAEYNQAKNALTWIQHKDALSQKVFAYGLVAKLKELEDSGRIDAMLQRMEAAKSKVPAHNIVKFARDADSDFSYVFALELAETPNDPNRVAYAVTQEFSKSVKESYVNTYPGAKENSLVVDFSSVKVDGRRIEGRATVLSIKPLSLTYDATSRRGKLSVRFNPGQEEATRTWIRRNLEALARDKNIQLTTDERPPAGHFYSLGEKIEGNVMEIEFRTE